MFTKNPILFMVILTSLASSIAVANTAAANKNQQLNPKAPPGLNFDLADWNISLPVDTNKDGKVDTIPGELFKKGFEYKPYFYTADDGGMVFTAFVDGVKTSKNTKYTRTELREMLRRDDYSIKTQGVTKNNWVFSSVRGKTQREAGGVDGRLEATVAVNNVTVTGDSKQIGRVIIGQIHAKDDEPARLYYRKLPYNSKGVVYLAHEPREGDEQYYEFNGSRASNAKEPEDGIALNEKFSYVIDVKGDTLTVTLIREGKEDITHIVDIKDSGYHKRDQYMYFKAGVYNQNNSGDPKDYVQATFYRLENTHKGYDR
ncbi:polysaccharide lyase family 7 protein [Paraglaciecola aquimarina]|uniref:Polysaccharide lyase family 7 protein n=1 Tax=Paraglaciecola algarum TaxID=3050085 RepID=A0ABS9D3K1_9ALTE|nr:polysaccharide lyase family 7 protein [Paraglaciecola sp. G1-23]MCF2947517.1 polysaccharide lyase family 7 protein [Paraglaciecola sp. G1-23]